MKAALAPLESIRIDLPKLAQGEIQNLTTNVPSEVRPLVQEVNRLLELLGRRLKQSRTAIGNLAHSLKTPLTLLTQLASEPPLAVEDKLRSRLVKETNQIRSLVDRELKRARLAGAGSPGTRFIPAQNMPALTQTLERVYADKELAIETEGPSTSVPWPDQEDMLELLGNVGDNACKWARKQVRFRLEADGELKMTIEDDGPGCTIEQRENLTARGVRLDESKEGHGLGLAIAQDIVEHYGGQIDFDESPGLRGLRVTVRLPPPDL